MKKAQEQQGSTRKHEALWDAAHRKTKRTKITDKGENANTPQEQETHHGGKRTKDQTHDKNS